MSTTAPRAREKRARTESWIVTALLAIIALMLFWQAVSYRGLVALLAEWQFNLFGSYRPSLTYILFLLLFGLPFFLVWRFRTRRARKIERRAGIGERAVRGAKRLTTVLLSLAAASGAGAIIALLLTLTLPSDSGTPNAIAVADTATPPSGPAVLSGTVLYERTTAFDESFLFFHRDVRFAPVVVNGGGAQGSTLRYFVELRPEEVGQPNPATQQLNGILKQGGLPGELVRLYRYAGYRVEQPYYVLFDARASMTWPFRMIAVELLLAGLIFLLIALLQHGHTKRLRKKVAAAAVATEPVPSA